LKSNQDYWIEYFTSFPTNIYLLDLDL
jgi:hypothetical protein